MPGWAWMLFGLTVGLSVALAIYIADRRPVVHESNSDQNPVPSSIREDEASGAGAEESEQKYDFYEMLPVLEVVIPETETPARLRSRSERVNDPGSYVVQAGSFNAFADADRRQARLALLGIESRIERVTIDEKTWHRVRIGPISDLGLLNNVRDQLGGAEIEYLLIHLRPQRE